MNDDDNIIDMTIFRAKKEGKTPPPRQTWPINGRPIEPVTIAEPQERRILVEFMESKDGYQEPNLFIEGFIGLTNTFLAVGDAAGQIKFAAAPGVWKYVTDVTGLEEFDSEFPEDFLEEDLSEDD